MSREERKIEHRMKDGREYRQKERGLDGRQGAV